jgi:hypothetical protein
MIGIVVDLASQLQLFPGYGCNLKSEQKQDAPVAALGLHALEIEP